MPRKKFFGVKRNLDKDHPSLGMGKAGKPQKGAFVTTEARTVEVKPEYYSYVFNPYRGAIARVSPGDRVTIHTNDAFESRILSEDDVASKALATAKSQPPAFEVPAVDARERGVLPIQRQEVREVLFWHLLPPRPQPRHDPLQVDRVPEGHGRRQ